MDNFISEQQQVADHEINKYIKKNAISSSDKKSEVTKYVDLAYSGAPVDNLGSFVLLNGIASGNDFYQRTNRAIIAKKLKIKFSFFQQRTAVGYYPSTTARIIIFWDNDSNGITPVISDLLLDVIAAGTTSSNNFSHKNMNNKGRFIFLFDKRYALPAYSITTVNQINTVNSPHRPNNEDWCESLNIKLDSLITRYNSTGLNINDINNGSMYFFVLGTNSTSSWNVNFCSRFSYLDV